MPVEIKELIIRTNIISDDPRPSRDRNLINEKQLRQIVDSCVDRVLKSIERKNDR
jgi:hypothetical protein